MKRYEKIYRNWHVHNVLAHPASHILRLLGAHGVADFVHNETSPGTESAHMHRRHCVTECDDCGRFVVAEIYEYACDCGGHSDE